MAESVDSSGSAVDVDKDFELTAEHLVHDYDDEGTMEEEENMSSGTSDNNELDDLQKEGDMPLETLLTMYGYDGASENDPYSDHHDSRGSTSEEDILNNQDLTLDKEEVARDILRNDDGSETSVDELLKQVQPSSTVRLLQGSVMDDYCDDDEEDEDYLPIRDEESWKKSIQVGPDYQAVVEDSIELNESVRNISPCAAEARLLWDPNTLSEEKVCAYLEAVQQSKMADLEGVDLIPEGAGVKDDEQALYLLVQSDFNTEEALRRRKLQTTTTTEPLGLWSEEECTNFESGLRIHGKNFFLIQQNKVRTKAVGELVQFYYFWKKTERQQAFCNRGKLERKKYSINPGITDYTDRFAGHFVEDPLDEDSNGCSCSPPGANGKIENADTESTLTTMKRPHTDLSDNRDMTDAKRLKPINGFQANATMTEVGN